VTDLAVSAFELTKRYGDVTALESARLRVGRAEIYGFLGLNGAGKTTTIRLLLGMMPPLPAMPRSSAFVWGRARTPCGDASAISSSPPSRTQS
jgi:ABC-type multidrug transport system ATPase subunit